MKTYVFRNSKGFIDLDSREARNPAEGIEEGEKGRK